MFMIDILFMLEYFFDSLEWKICKSTVNSFYVDFQKILKIHAALQVLLQIVSSRVNF